MNTTFWKLGMAAILTVAAGTASAAVVATPGSVTFNKLTDSAVITLSRDGVPLPASAVRGARLMVDDSNYSHQFQVTVKKGGNAEITLAPDPVYCEEGSFDLQILTSAGTAHVEVKTPLDEMATSIENRAARMGVTTEELERLLTLPKTPLPAYYRISLPEFMVVGQRFSLPGPSKESVKRIWKVNGQVVPSEPDGGLSYVFTQAGVNAIAFQDSDAGHVTAAWMGTLSVVTEAPIAVTTEARQSIILNGPEGYGTYTWERDGEVVSTSETVMATYDQPGEYAVYLFASNPTADNNLTFRALQYVITVK